MGDDLYIADWMSGQLLRVTKTGFSAVISGLKNPTDPNYAEEFGVLAIPEHGTNRVLYYKATQYVQQAMANHQLQF